MCSVLPTANIDSSVLTAVCCCAAAVACALQAYEDDVCVDLVLELACGGSLQDRIKRGSISLATAAR